MSEDNFRIIERAILAKIQAGVAKRLAARDAGLNEEQAAAVVPVTPVPMRVVVTLPAPPPAPRVDATKAFYEFYGSNSIMDTYSR